MNTSIIGGADGPTTIYLVGKLGESWLNIFGLAYVIMLLLPNIIYAIKNRGEENLCTNKAMNILEQVGRYACMFFMVFNVGFARGSFPRLSAVCIYFFGNLLLMLSYWIVWIFYFKKRTYKKQMALAIIPTCLFLLSGITSLNVVLVIFAVIFGIGHIYVTNKNTLREVEA